MTNNADQYAVHFHNRARDIFFSLYHTFQQSVAEIDRQRDENVFQRLQAKYGNELKSQLNVVALQELDRLPSGVDHNEFHHLLTWLIQEYSNEFLQKGRSL